MLALGLPGHSLTLSVDAAGFTVEARAGDGSARLATGAAPQPRRWYEIAVTVAEGRIALTQTPLQHTWGAADAGMAEAALPAAAWDGLATLSFAATRDAAGHATAHFNGRIEDPLLLRGAPQGIAQGITLAEPEALLASGRLAAWWDFSAGQEGEAILDRGAGALHGRVVNFPARP